MKLTTKSKSDNRIDVINRLFNRCLVIQFDKFAIEVKVMGDREEAAKNREILLAAFTAIGIEVGKDLAPSDRKER